MLIEKETYPDPSLNWPESYYGIDDPAARKAALLQVLGNSPSAEEERRLEIFQKRFRKDRDDLFMEAWLLIKMSEQDKISFLNRKSKEKHLRSCMSQLMLTNEPDELLRKEWYDFAGKWIQTCLTSQYRKAAFGILTVNDTVLAGRIANEINTVTRDIPARFSLQSEFTVFRNIMIDVYRHTVEDSGYYFE